MWQRASYVKRVAAATAVVSILCTYMISNLLYACVQMEGVRQFIRQEFEGKLEEKVCIFSGWVRLCHSK